MAHFAQLDENNTVTQVIVISNDVCGEPTLSFPDTCPAGRAYIANTLKLAGQWRQTSFSGSFRGVYAGLGYTYDPDLNEFAPPVVADETE
jgi:hypothetical protein